MIEHAVMNVYFIFIKLLRCTHYNPGQFLGPVSAGDVQFLYARGLRAPPSIVSHVFTFLSMYLISWYARLALQSLTSSVCQVSRSTTI